MKLSESSIEYWIERMAQIARFAHREQTRNDGTPYIAHPERVAAAVEPRLKPIAWGHDLIEDTNVTLEDLMKVGFPLYIIQAVRILTHLKGVPNIEYWAAIKTNSDALSVKKRRH